MKRRDFIKAPALTLLLPTPTTMDRLLGEISEGQVSDPVSNTQTEPEQRLNSDYITYVPGIEYFYIGNGDIQGAVQYSPRDPRCSFFGFTLMNPERFCRKWTTYLYHPEAGLGNSRLGVTVDDLGSPADIKSGMFHGVQGHAVAPDNLRSISWKYPEGVPVVSLEWKAGPCSVEEEFFVPWEGAVLFRRVTISNTSGRQVRASVNQNLYPNFGLFDTISTDEKEKCANARGLADIRLAIIDRPSTVAGRYNVATDLGIVPAAGKAAAVLMYSLNGGETLLSQKSFEKLWLETVDYWKVKSSFRTGNDTLDHLFNVSRTCLRSTIARSGKMDGGTWMYNMEWLGDQILAMEGLLRSGNVDLARTMFENTLRRYIGPDGRTIESGRWFGYEYTEVNQNGVMLYGAWLYYCWTGDLAILQKNWDRIKLCGDFPLQSYFVHPESGMVHNKREFWERSDSHGVQDGFELAYQFWVSFGLQRGAELAEKVGDSATAQRWIAASKRMKQSALEHPRFRLVEDGHLIKRRTIDGTWQKHFVPPNRSRMPAGSPLAVNEQPQSEPDTITAYPILFAWVDPQSELARNSLSWVDRLWNQNWSTGGYPRYNTTSEDNPPAPWALASMLVARAYAESRNSEKAWRVLQWLRDVHGGLSGGWFERYGQSITTPMPPVGVVGWIWYEIIAFSVYHVAGFRPEMDKIIIHPWLPDPVAQVQTRQTVRGAIINLSVTRDAGRKKAIIDGKPVPLREGRLELDYPKAGTVTRVEIEI